MDFDEAVPRVSRATRPQSARPLSARGGANSRPFSAPIRRHDTASDRAAAQTTEAEKDEAVVPVVEPEVKKIAVSLQKAVEAAGPATTRISSAASSAAGLGADNQPLDLRRLGDVISVGGQATNVLKNNLLMRPMSAQPRKKVAITGTHFAESEHVVPSSFGVPSSAHISAHQADPTRRLARPPSAAVYSTAKKHPVIVKKEPDVSIVPTVSSVIQGSASIQLLKESMIEANPELSRHRNLRLKKREDPPPKQKQEPDTHSEIDETSEMDHHLADIDPRVIVLGSRDPLIVMERLKNFPESSEFVYLRPIQTSLSIPLNPYHLEVCEHAQLEQGNFFTMSAFGVTHFIDSQPFFTDLDQWRREHSMFNSIIRISVFANFKLWKSFKVWRHFVRHGKMAVAKTSLLKNLYFASPNFQPALFKIGTLCHELRQLRLHNLNDCHLLDLAEFVRRQIIQSGGIRARVESAWKEATALALSVCASTLESLEARLFGGDSDSNSIMTAEQVINETQGAQWKAKHSTIAAPDSPKVSGFKYTVQASKRVEHRRLHQFLKLVDILIFGALHELVIKSMDDILVLLMTRANTIADVTLEVDVQVGDLSLLSPVKKEKPKPAAVFQTTIILNDDSLSFEPDQDTFASTILELAENFIDSVCLPVRLLAATELQGYTELYDAELELVLEGPKHPVAHLVTHDEKYMLIIEGFHLVLSEAFLRAEEYRERFIPTFEMVIENSQLDISEIEREAENGNVTLPQFRQYLLKYKNQVVELARLPDAKNIGILHVISADIKEEFRPSPEGCLHDFELLLPALLARRQRVLMEKVGKGNSKLNSVPMSTSEFVSVLEAVNEISSMWEDLEDGFTSLTEHYAMLREQGVQVPEEDRAVFQMLSPEFMQLKTSLDIQEDMREENIARWNRSLVAEVRQFEDRVTHLKLAAQNPILLQETELAQSILDTMSDLKQQVADRISEGKILNHHQRVFNMPVTRSVELEKVSADVELKYSLWDSLIAVETANSVWMGTLITDLRTEELLADVQLWFKTAVRCERELEPNPVSASLKSDAEALKILLPVVGDLNNSSLKQRHWERIDELLGVKLERDPDLWERPLTLSYVNSLNIIKWRKEIETISNEATQEELLEEMLAKVQRNWANTEFTVNQFKDHKEVYVLGSVDDIQALLDESLVTMGTITCSRYVAGIKEEVAKMEKALNIFSDTLSEWVTCQRNWMYLEPILTAPDIAKQLPQEGKIFADVDKGWKIIMKKTSENSNALRACTSFNYRETFSNYNEQLDKIQKSLEDYLETKRMAFPRFYFLSNDELLEILAETRNVQAVQPHMNKCFDAIKSLDFGDDPKSIDIHAMISPENEAVGFGKYVVKARGNVENWLTEVEKAMHKHLRVLAKEAVVEYSVTPRPVWVTQQPGQIVIMVAQIYWAKRGMECFHSPSPLAALNSFFSEVKGQLSELCGLVRGSLSSLDRKKFVALITIDVNNRDIVENMISSEIFDESEFGWQMRLRYYWDDTLPDGGDCDIRQVQARFLYAYEYLGASARLVITPLTDRCYMCCTGALHFKLGGAPAGPAGTGKTETTKDLAKALGTQCVVFNCGETLDYKFMGKFFKGLAQCGAWACFDEFNRINIEVLSVVAQQVLSIQNALRAGVSKFEFEGVEIKLINTFGVFITMNPGYAGRTELPDNLKALFRPVSMMIPDYALVAEVMLFSEGFEDAKTLSRKMVNLYKLASEQLSQQDHYDFGMRAVKSVLVMAGSLKRENPTLTEDIVLIRAMRDSNVPKFLKADLQLFQAIVSDLFPGVVIPHHDTAELRIAIEDIFHGVGMQIVTELVMKAIQLYETFSIRFGVMTVGPTGGGKTAAALALRDALTKLAESGAAGFNAVRTFTLNPKAISMNELYGSFNLLTNEWTDGLGASIVRGACADTTSDRKWIVFDGPVDAVWIENMNTVLDDNRTLCLPNGERIKLDGEMMRMLFEVEDLAVASPATVSRCGMVYLSSEILGWRPLVESWSQSKLQYFPEDSVHFLMGLFDSLVPAAIKFSRRNCKEYLPSVDSNLVSTLCFIFQSLTAAVDLEPLIRSGEINEYIRKVISFGLVWSVGGNLDAEDKIKFNEFCRDEMPQLSRFPTIGLVFDYYVENSDQSLRPWNDIVPAFTYSAETPFVELLVPTMDTVRFSFLTRALLSAGRCVCLNGLSGTGKSVIVTDTLRKMEISGLPGGGKVSGFSMMFSAQTSSNRTQEMLELRLEKHRKGVYGALPGHKLVCFVDDVNMPQREVYGAQAPIELLRQMIDRTDGFRLNGGFYDRKEHSWMNIVDTTLVAACGPPGGGRNPMTNRFIRHFSLLCVAPASATVLKVIFGSILSGFLHSDFAVDVRALAKGAVDASIDVYNRISAELLPTPAKSHYTFNLRDLSKVFQGILSVTAPNVADSKVFASLWTHECMRVFGDRLVNEEDKNWFQRLLHEMLKRFFNVDWKYESVFEGPYPILFGDFLRMGATGSDRYYEQVTNPAGLPNLLATYLDDYNNSTPKQMNLVFFKDAISHISRLCRILRQPRGNAMLVGIGGSGKQSLSRLSAFISDCSLVQIEITKGYGTNEFREDLKKLFVIAGVERRRVVFLFTDTQIVKESFLEDINSILNAGDVPNLFIADDKEKVISDCRDYNAQLGRAETRDTIYATFIDSVRENLHIVMAMSPVGDAFRSRCRMFPSLINCCTIDWVQPWPKDALLSVSLRFISALDLGQANEEIREPLSLACVDLHVSVATAAEKFFQSLRRRYYVTPKSYLDLITLFGTLFEQRKNTILTDTKKFQDGLKKLYETNGEVEKLSAELEVLGPELAAKTATTNELVEQVEKDQAAAQVVRETVTAETADVMRQTEQIRAIQTAAQRDLDEALPALNAAVQALNSLTKNDVVEVKSFTKPPDLVRTVMEAVLVLLGEKTDWDVAKRCLGDGKFLQRLMEFDKDNIEERRLAKLQKYIDLPDFTAEKVGKVSVACRGMCMWARAMHVYARVLKEVQPQRERVRIANAGLAEAQGKLRIKEAELGEVEAKVSQLQHTLAHTQSEKRKLAQYSDLCQKRLERAGKLMSALSDEAVRWSATAESLGRQLSSLVGDAFLSAACVSYLGAFTGKFREELVALWIDRCDELNIPHSPNFSLRGTLADPVSLREWAIWGLPSDDVSVDNGVLVKQGRRWPIMIDPQGQANRWVKKMEGSSLRIIKTNDTHVMRILEGAVRLGQSVLLEDVGESLDPSLEPVLQKQIFKRAGRTLIRLGDSDIDYDNRFLFYVTTKLSNPHFMPEVCIATTIINFTVTSAGLEEQLLGDVVRKERPDLEELKDKLVVSMSADKKQLKDLEDKVLRMLAESSGMILDNEALIETLQKSKSTSTDINMRVIDAETAEKEISEARGRYLPVAVRGSILYFVVADLTNIDPMYQYSLQYFQKLFGHCVSASEKSDDLDKRLQILLDFVTEFMFVNVCRGLFARHVLVFSFLISTSIQRQIATENPAEKIGISADEWNFFLRGGRPLLPPHPNPDKSWITDKMWEQVCVSSKGDVGPPVILNFATAILDAPVIWRAWATSDNPQTYSNFPLTTLSPFQKLICLKILRPDKVLFGVMDFVLQSMGERFTQAPAFSLPEVFRDTNSHTPIIFVLSTGADPTNLLIKFAEEQGYGERLYTISLGQGQGPVAEKLISVASKKGDWVCLMNCHLATSWMGKLETIIEALSSDASDDAPLSKGGIDIHSVHPSFRLWLTSMPSPDFPVAILQNGIKLTNEPPKGIRANILRSVGDIGEEWARHGPSPIFQKLIFSLCFFHAVVQERGRFGSLGWNIKYEFSESDMKCTRMLVQSFLSQVNHQDVLPGTNPSIYTNDVESIPWDALVYITGHINYGGRVTDDLDRKCLLASLSKFLSPSVLSEKHKFTKDGTYTTVPVGSLEEALAHVRGYPATDSPLVFGLHENANISFNLSEGNNLVEIILGMQPRMSGSHGGGSSEEIVEKIAAEISMKIPANLEIESAINPDAFKVVDGLMISLGTVLMHECERFNRLLETLRVTLGSLQKAIKGLVVMSLDLELMFTSLLNNHVPKLWADVAYPSMKPLGSWVQDLLLRVSFLGSWLNSKTPNCFWLPGLFFPQGFMTGVLQAHARKYLLPIDTLSFGFKVQVMEDESEVNSKPQDGVYINGLFLEGAKWDRRRRRLQASDPAQMFTKMPVIHFVPTKDRAVSAEDYQCPLYKTAQRAGVLSTTGQSTNFIICVDLPTKDNPDVWILQGTALLCQLSE